MHTITRVIADDLTGAADSAIAFCGTTRTVRLLLTEDHPDWTNTAVEAAVLDASTRHLSPADAAARTAALARSAVPAAVLLKKIDSVLRGNIAAELAALKAQQPDRLVILAPAFPSAGRTTRGGRQLVRGQALSETTLWHMEARPAPATIADAIAPLRCATIGIDTVRAGAERLTAALVAARADGQVAVCDAETDADLAAVAAAGSSVDGPLLWVGSAGLAAALAAHHIAASHNPAHRTPAHYDPAAGSGTPITVPAGQAISPGTPYLAVIGSAGGLARQQAAALVTAGAHEVAVPVTLLLDGSDGQRQAQADRLAVTAAHDDVVVRLSGAPRPEQADLVATRLAAVVAPAAGAARLLVLTGGHTARAVLDRCGQRALSPVCEPEPGAVLSRADTGTAVLTKAGAFGDTDTLLRCVKAVRADGPAAP